ncbi:MAG: hypothetical protein M3P30_02790 [Chloroflexota bacterium]|nr:hypothetical protein [Chloroflexota bacterium]
MRQIGYRAAATACVFTGLWFVLGLLLISTPLPGALGIGGQLVTAWLLLFLVALAMTGATLVVAAFNGIFPTNVRAPRRAQSLWAAPPGSSSPPVRRPAAAGSRTSRPPHRG